MALSLIHISSEMMEKAKTEMVQKKNDDALKNKLVEDLDMYGV